jgi:hypothetical protein
MSSGHSPSSNSRGIHARVPRSRSDDSTRCPRHRSSDAYAAHGASLVLKTYLEELGRLSLPQNAHKRIYSPNGLPSQPTGVNGKPTCVSEEDDDGSAGYRAVFAVSDATSEGENARLEHGHLVELERQPSTTLVMQTEWDQCLAQLTEELDHRRLQYARQKAWHP